MSARTQSVFVALIKMVIYFIGLDIVCLFLLYFFFFASRVRVAIWNFSYSKVLYCVSFSIYYSSFGFILNYIVSRVYLFSVEWQIILLACYSLGGSFSLLEEQFYYLFFFHSFIANDGNEILYVYYMRS